MKLEWFLSSLLLLSALGVILARKPVFSGLSFLATLILLSGLYFELSAHFIGVLQILIYAGAILVIFMFVIILFQDAYQKLSLVDAKSSRLWLVAAASAFLVSATLLLYRLLDFSLLSKTVPEGYGSVESLGKILFVDFFFPFEAVIMIFLVALVGSVFVAKKES